MKGPIVEGPIMKGTVMTDKSIMEHHKTMIAEGRGNV